jgi:hypothetical protein
VKSSTLAALILALCASLTFAAEAPQPDGPDEAMMQPVHELVSFMITLDATHLRKSLASSDLTVMENFAPYLFTGNGAQRRWEQGFRRHAADGHLSDLTADFDKAVTFERHKDRVYFSLPTTWKGKSGAQAFVEQGAWAFVLTWTRDGWRIRNYSWVVTQIVPVN